MFDKQTEMESLTHEAKAFPQPGLRFASWGTPYKIK